MATKITGEPKFTWDKDSGICTCTIKAGRQTFVGEALCCEDDKDMCNERTGNHIAFDRAMIKYYKYIRDYELKPEISFIISLQSTMERSLKLNRSSYEYKMIWKRRNRLEQELNIVNTFIDSLRKNLRTYIDNKEEMYQHLRKNRAKKVKENM